MSRIPLLASLSLLLLAVPVPAAAAEPTFRVHAINAQSTYSACVAFDVNQDGRIDVVCGGFWYEAPDWKKHFVRDVEVIGGRFDGYSHLPMDVNRDGWMDYVSANYRSKAIYWIEHPGAAGKRWKKHLIDTPGHMETARLVDIDGDGQLDVLPNCIRRASGEPFAEWWELRHDRKTGRPEWIRHPLPAGIAGHGIGFGDLDGDGRGDIVGPRGWLQAPADPRGGRWILHSEFVLDRDCGIPILVFDVDADGDNDLVWGRGHRFGLYWLEQDTGADGQRRWQRHAIDTSWSQPHSLLLADIDNDGTPEVIAGKRYMGHDGKDPGEYDPLVAHGYSFDREQKTWRRQLIAPAGRAGFGLDPKVLDLDGDGDLDLVGAGRSGLYWFENLLVNKAGVVPARRVVPRYEDHARLLVLKDETGREREVRTAADLARRRAHLLAGMQEAMGELPASFRRVPLEIEVLDETVTDKYVRRRIRYSAEAGDRVPAYLLVPRDLTGPAPAMLCLHQTTRIGKDEPAGLGGRPTLHYAHELAERGYVCIVPDYPSFGEYPYDFKQQGAHHASGTMKAIWNNIRAIDVLETLPEVNRDQIGCIGHSLGGHNSLFTAAFEQRIRAVVTSCGFTAFHHYYGGKLAGWTSDRYMPRIRDVYKNDPDQVPFDFYGVLGAIAPRGIFINAPLHDGNFDVRGVQKVVDVVRGAYAIRDAEGNLEAVYPDSGHDFPDEIRQQAYRWLDGQLKK
jgi:dienelactone hydrolase